MAEASPAIGLCFLWKERSFSLSQETFPNKFSSIANSLACVYLIVSKRQGSAPGFMEAVQAVLMPVALAGWFWQEFEAAQMEIYGQEVGILEQKIMPDLYESGRSVIQRIDGSYAFQKMLSKYSHSVKQLVFALPPEESGKAAIREMVGEFLQDPNIFRHTVKPFPDIERSDTSLEEGSSVAIPVVGVLTLLVVTICTLSFYRFRK